MQNKLSFAARLENLAPRLGAPAWILTLGGIAVIYGGWRWETPWLFGSGIILLGLGVVLLGVETLYAPALPSNRAPGEEQQTGRSFSATMWGFWFLFIGVVVLLFGLALLLGAGDILLNFVQQRPGLAIIIMAVSLVTYGLPSVIGAGRPTSTLSLVASLPARLLGLVAVLFGLAAFALGVFEIINPSGFDSLFGG